MSVSLSDALNTMTQQLAIVDRQLADQFNTFKNNILTFDKNVSDDQAIFNSSRRQTMTDEDQFMGIAGASGKASTLSGGSYYGQQYNRTIGGRLGDSSKENLFAYQNGIPRYI